MKKRISLIGIALFVLAGCSTNEGAGIESSSSLSNEVASSIEIESSSQESSIIEESSSVVINSGVETVQLVPQQSDVDSGYTLENDSLLQQLDEKIKNASVVGIEGELAIQYTGFDMGEEGNKKAVFIFVNRSQKTVKEIRMLISFKTTDGGVILDQEPFQLTEEEFGISEPGTAMPMYLAIPPENEEVLTGIKDMSTVVNTIDDIEYEEIK